MHGAEKLETVNENASLNLSIGFAIAPMLRDRILNFQGQPTPRFERRQSCVVRG